MTITEKLILRPLAFMNSCVPESRWKNRARAGVLAIRNALPRELMVRRGDVVLQVGMWRERNVGRLCRCVGTTGRVILIEADQRAVERIRNWAREHGYENLTVIHRGAWRQRDRLRFNLGENHAHSRLDGNETVMLGEAGRDPFQDQQWLDVDAVDNLLAAIGVDRVDYAEITVNGAELPVLEGMTGALPKLQRVFVAGYARYAADQSPTNVKIADYLQQQGFRTRISRTRSPHASEFDPAAAEKWGEMEGHVFGWKEVA